MSYSQLLQTHKFGGSAASNNNNIGTALTTHRNSVETINPPPNQLLDPFENKGRVSFIIKFFRKSLKQIQKL